MLRFLCGLLSGLLCSAALSHSALADTFWDHNGSVMRLVTDGDQRQFLYERPREVLEGAGVAEGTVLFDGYRVGNKYVGKAKRFSRNCPAPLSYDVSGNVVRETKVVLKGRREVYDDNCRPTGRFRTDTLVFAYIGQQRGAEVESNDEITGSWVDSGYADSLWDHNGSIMRLISEGESRKFVYEQPRSVLQGAGVTQGTVLFDGYRRGDSYRGTARRFSKNCPTPLPYDVSGDVVRETKVVLKGRREVYDSNCRPTGRFTTDILVFGYLSADRKGGEELLSEEQALIRAIAILKGDPYGETISEVARRIDEQQLITAGTVCGGRVRSPLWQFHVFIPEREHISGSGDIDGYLVIDGQTGRMVCAGLPFLD